MPRLKENYRAPANLENVTARPGKGAVPKPAVKLRRPALGDLGNRIQNANTGAPKAPAPQRKVEKEVPAPLLITSTPKKAEPGAVKEGKSEVIAYSANRLKDVEEQAEGSDPQLVAEYVEDIYRYLMFWLKGVGVEVKKMPGLRRRLIYVMRPKFSAVADLICRQQYRINDKESSNMAAVFFTRFLLTHFFVCLGEIL